MTKRKDKLFKAEADRVVVRNWRCVVDHRTQELEEAIRRAMLRAYHKGRKDGEGWKDIDSQRGLEERKK